MVEITGIDPSTGNLMVNTVFDYNPVTDVFSYTGRSVIYSDIAERRGWGREELASEVSLRKSVLSAMQEQQIRDYISVSRIIQGFYIDRRQVLEKMSDLKSFLS